MARMDMAALRFILMTSPQWFDTNSFFTGTGLLSI